jgi:CheY-like chemotaxis protein
MARILIVDDEEDVRRTLRAMLEHAGFSVIEAADGVAGVAAFLAKRPDLVIVDVIMPRQTGIEAIQHIRAAAPATPVIAMSGGGRAADMRFLRVAGELGATAELAKPIRRAELLQAISACLG